MSFAKLTITETAGVESAVTVTVEAEPPIPCWPNGDPVVEKLSDVQAAAIYAARALSDAMALSEWRTFILGDERPPDGGVPEMEMCEHGVYRWMCRKGCV